MNLPDGTDEQMVFQTDDTFADAEAMREEEQVIDIDEGLQEVFEEEQVDDLNEIE